MTKLAIVLFGVVVASAGCERSSSSRPPPPPQWGPGPYPQQYPPPGHQPMQPPPPNAPPRTNDDIMRGVNAAYPRFTTCYRESESYMTGKSGNVTIFFDIAPHGHVTAASGQPPPGYVLEGRPLMDAKLTDCLVRRFYELRFSPASDASSASFLFTFAP